MNMDDVERGFSLVVMTVTTVTAIIATKKNLSDLKDKATLPVKETSQVRSKGKGNFLPLLIILPCSL
ncbi:hypothetical protein ABE28_009380 [Peribacillus muralis]|uniref:Uncharacterized protein n=1 Tax=Peribacillus muralis TaxID=264697 RepID=A0A1B3XN00_9BACI|nr:hypothetical protein ABE28_009380 [Peribacillus muralis]